MNFSPQIAMDGAAKASKPQQFFRLLAPLVSRALCSTLPF
jgi:hypothetical protein